MTEKQNVEYKIFWRDEFLKWICGFANAQGGTMIIGASDNGDIAGLPDAAKLLEDIPNKVKDILGIMVDVNSSGKRREKLAKTSVTRREGVGKRSGRRREEFWNL